MKNFFFISLTGTFGLLANTQLWWVDSRASPSTAAKQSLFWALESICVTKAYRGHGPFQDLTGGVGLNLRFGGIFQNNNFCFPSHLGFFSEPPFITRGGNSLAADSGSASRVSESGSRIRNPSCANIWPSSLLNKQVSFVPELGFQS